MSEVIENWEEQTFPLVEAAKKLKAADAAYRKMVQVGISITFPNMNGRGGISCTASIVLGIKHALRQKEGKTGSV